MHISSFMHVHEHNGKANTVHTNERIHTYAHLYRYSEQAFRHKDNSFMIVLLSWITHTVLEWRHGYIKDS